MATLTLLGTGAASTDPHRTTTMLAVTEAQSTFLIDCGGDVIQRCQAAGLPLDHIDGIYITHEHPDHVGGFPLFVEKIWLAGRSRAIHIYGIEPALEQAKRIWGAFHTDHWDAPELRWHQIDTSEHAPVLENDLWSIVASPGIHGVPVTGLRFQNKTSGAVLAYSCDTERSESITRLAAGADLLVHEASGGVRGHSSVEDAVHVAKAGGSKRLVLVHLPPGCESQQLDPHREAFEELCFGDELQQFTF